MTKQNNTAKEMYTHNIGCHLHTTTTNIICFCYSWNAKINKTTFVSICIIKWKASLFCYTFRKGDEFVHLKIEKRNIVGFSVALAAIVYHAQLPENHSHFAEIRAGSGAGIVRVLSYYYDMIANEY